MIDSRWDRLAAASGIVFVVLSAVGILIVPGSLAYNAPAEEVARYFVENDDLLHLGVSVLGGSIFFFFGFVGSLWSVLRRAEGETGWLSALAFGGGVATGTLLLAQHAIFRAAFHGLHVSVEHVSGEGLNPQGATALWAVVNNFLFAPVFTLAVLLAATAIIAIRTQALPGWLGWTSAALTLLSLVVGGFAPYLVFPLFLLWVIATSVVLIRRAGSVQGARS